MALATAKSWVLASIAAAALLATVGSLVPCSGFLASISSISSKRLQARVVPLRVQSPSQGSKTGLRLSILSASIFALLLTTTASVSRRLPAAWTTKPLILTKLRTAEIWQRCGNALARRRQSGGLDVHRLVRPWARGARRIPADPGRALNV